MYDLVPKLTPEKVRIGVIGVGRWGPNIVRALTANPSTAVAQIVDLDEVRLDLIGEQFPDVPTSSDIKAVLEDPTVSAVALATPGTSHFELARKAMEAGKHVFVEKPLTTSVDDAHRLSTMARDKGLVLMVGHVFVYNQAVQYIRGMIATGELGNVYHCSSLRTNLGPFLNDINAAWDLACHDISIANYWLGSAPVAVRATGGSWVHKPIEEVVFAMLRYPGDVLVSIHVSWVSPVKRREITLVGDQAMLTFDDSNLSEPIRIYNTGVPPVNREELTPNEGYVSFRSSVREGDILIPKVHHREPLMIEMNAFVDAIRDGKETLSDGWAGLEVVKVLNALTRSLEESGREVEIR